MTHVHILLILVSFTVLNCIGCYKQNRGAPKLQSVASPNCNGVEFHHSSCFEMRLQTYIDAICSRCLLRDVECGCAQGHLNPPVRLLKDYAQKYHEWTQQAINFQLEQHSHRWLVLDFSGGVGNQLLKFVNGLQYALVTGRILVLKVERSLHLGFKYNSLDIFDSVVDWMTTDFLEEHDFRFYLDDPWSTLKVDLWARSGVEHTMCSDLGDLNEYETIHMVSGVQDVHLINSNPYCQDRMRVFRGLNFFYLSHFLWSGTKELPLTVDVASSPFPLGWDGERRLSEIISDLRASNPVKMVALHIRVARSFEYLDTYHYPRGWQRCLGSVGPCDSEGRCYDKATHADPTDFCYSSSLDSISTCLGDLLHEWLPSDILTNVSAETVGLNSSVVVLWATDHDGYTERLLNAVSSLPAVHVVRIRYRHGDRYDFDLLSGLCDILFLGEADAMIATTMSTFSYAVHARSLMTPHYLSYQDPCQGQGVCTLANGPEAGLLAFGRMHDNCYLRAGDHEEMNCARIRDGCVSILMDPGWRHDASSGETIGCLQSCALCTSEDITSLFPYQVNISHANQFQHIWAKRGRVLHLNQSLLQISTCPPIADQFKWIKSRFDDNYYVSHHFKSIVPSRTQFQSSIQCLDACCVFPNANRTCQYRNLFFFNGVFYFLSVGGEGLLDPRESEVLNCARCPEQSHLGSRNWVFKTQSKSNVFLPERRQFSSVGELNGFFENKTVQRSSGIHFLFAHCHDNYDGAIHWNLGHALLDELYPAWYGLLKFGLEDHDFTILLKNSQATYNQNHEIFAAFSGRPFQDIDEWPHDTWIHIDTLLAGVGWTGLNSVSRDYRLSGTKRNALKLFRNRMYTRYGIPHPAADRHCGHGARRTAARLKAVIVPNKRGIGNLEHHAQMVRAKCPNIDVVILDFRETFLWEDQLQIFRDADIYVSGIGTGFVCSFLLPDGAVAINLGSHQVYGDQDNHTYLRSMGYPKHNVVHFQDEFLSRSVDYSKVMYADPHSIRAGFNSSYVSDLICAAGRQVRLGFSIPVAPDENSSPLGRAAATLMQEDNRLYLTKATGLNPSTGEFSMECWARAEAFLCDEGWFARCGLQTEPGWHAEMQRRFSLSDYCT